MIPTTVREGVLWFVFLTPMGKLRFEAISNVSSPTAHLQLGSWISHVCLVLATASAYACGLPRSKQTSVGHIVTGLVLLGLHETMRQVCPENVTFVELLQRL